MATCKIKVTTSTRTDVEGKYVAIASIAGNQKVKHGDRAAILMWIEQARAAAFRHNHEVEVEISSIAWGRGD